MIAEMATSWLGRSEAALPPHRVSKVRVGGGNELVGQRGAELNEHVRRERRDGLLWVGVAQIKRP